MNNKLLDPAILLSVFLADRLAKALAMTHLPAPVQLAPFFSLTYVENTGAAFGMFRGNNIFFIVTSSVLVCALLILRRKMPERNSRIGMALILGGALGNLYDRLAYGYVVDFFDLAFFPAVFNLADSAITVGAGFLALGLKKPQPDGSAS